MLRFWVVRKGLQRSSGQRGSAAGIRRRRAVLPFRGYVAPVSPAPGWLGLGIGIAARHSVCVGTLDNKYPGSLTAVCSNCPVLHFYTAAPCAKQVNMLRWADALQIQVGSRQLVGKLVQL